MRSPLAMVFIGIVKGYRTFISPLSAPKCKYYPTCSTYALEALNRHGAIKGFLLSTWRVLRCNPWSYGGVDKVPLKGQWRSEPQYSMTDEELHEYWHKLDSAKKHQKGSSTSVDDVVKEQSQHNIQRALSTTDASARRSQ